jgi:exodeoxyribonuclease VII large subunit
VNEAPNLPAVITVTDLNRRTRELVERGFPLLWVAGEISNFMRAASGHCYFSLKDAQAQVRCVLFRHKAALLDFPLSNGMQVEVRATPTVYEQRGEFQLGVETMRRSGLGLLFEAFEKLKKRLDAEGLFASGRKRAIPAFPRAVGVVTSPAAAALRDVLTTLKRRMPALPVILYPAPVQGEGAGERIAGAIRAASARSEVDVLIVCRGGGSIEDLWAFNEEVVARAIAESAIPVVSGVGHETDFTIADFVADVRAPTPTAAAARVSPDRVELAQQLAGLSRSLSRAAWRQLERRMQQVDYLGKRLVHPGQRIELRREQLTHLAVRLAGAWRHRLDAAGYRVESLASRLASSRPDLQALEQAQRERVARLRAAAALYFERRAQGLKAVAAHLAHLNPQAVLERGYSIVTRTDGRIVRDAGEAPIGSRVRLSFARGHAGARIEGDD